VIRSLAKKHQYRPPQFRLPVGAFLPAFALLLALATLLDLPGLALAQAAPIASAPAIELDEGTVLASGHVLAGKTRIQPIPGQAIVRYADGQNETWIVEVSGAETLVYRGNRELVAKAEYVAHERDGKPSCFIYQTHIAPEWLTAPQFSGPQGSQPGQVVPPSQRQAVTNPDIATADDKVYSFREAPCPAGH